MLTQSLVGAGGSFFFQCLRTVALLFLWASLGHAKEIALTFDDAPVSDSAHFTSLERTKKLIQNLAALQISEVMIFANPCKSPTAIEQLGLYRKAGHLLANHTCNHPRYREVGFEVFTKDLLAADQQLKSLMTGQKYFRFPFLNEPQDLVERDRLREWLKQQGYKNGVVSVDNDDYAVSAKINQAKRLGKKIDYVKVEAILIQHILRASEFYHDLAVKTFKREPKQVLLLHEVDATVMFLPGIVKALRAAGWKIIPVSEAYQDEMYAQLPKNLYANNGIVAQWAMEVTGERIGYNVYDDLVRELNQLLDLPTTN